MSSTSQRGRPTPATGKGEEGSALIRQRVVAAVGWPKSAAAAGVRQRRMTKAGTPEASAASCNRREAVIGRPEISPAAAAKPV